MSVERPSVAEARGGAPSRYIDEATTRPNILAASFEDIQQGRIRASNRGDEWSAGELRKVENSLSRQLTKTLRGHDLWPFLEPLKGLAGARTARLLAVIGDPRRFPGQPCSNGHYLPPGFPVGAACPVHDLLPACSSEIDQGNEEQGFDGTDIHREFDSSVGAVEVSRAVAGATASELVGGCPGTLLEPRTTTGVRSVWHYLGLNVVDGQLPRLRRGVQADWNGKGRMIVLGPQGIAAQIVMQRTPKYREIYDTTKVRKLPLVERPIQAEKIARTVAAKAFVGDLLVAWKAAV